MHDPLPNFDPDQYDRELKAFLRREDGDSRNGTFQVESDHPAYSDGGTGASAIRDGVDDDPAGQPEIPTDTAGLIRYLLKLARVHPYLPAILLFRVDNPAASLRDLAPGCRLKRSALSEAIAKCAAFDPRLERILFGTLTGRHRVQLRRRRCEAQAASGPCADTSAD